MRSSNSVKNAIVAFIMNIITILIGFVSQKVFINILGTEYLGINGLFSNILSMLAIAELGIGSAIVYNLYKPVAHDDKERIKSLMLFYKNSYRLIAIIIFVIGIFIIPFLGFFIGEVNIHDNINYIYILFLIDTIASYLLTYKRSILYANQKTYITNIVHIGYLIFMNAFQIIFLIFTSNYIVYLFIKIIFRILENIVITIIANRKYPFIKEKDVKPIEKNIKKDIYTKVKGLIFHKVSTVVVLGTDNIVISKFLGVATVGLYSNYNLIIQAILNLFLQVFSSITASVGNLLVENDSKKSYKIYKNMLFMNAWLFTFASAGILCIMEPFVKVWIGEEYILPTGVLIVLVINMYVQGMRRTCNTFKEAAGVFYEDRYVPIIEAIVNIVASIIFVNIFGLAGVFIGTILSTTIVFLYSYPIFVYKPLFKRTYSQYIKDYVPYIIVSIFAVTLSYILTNLFIINNEMLQIIINLLVVLIVPNIIYIFTFYKTEEFNYYKELISNMIKSRK